MRLIHFIITFLIITSSFSQNFLKTKISNANPIPENTRLTTVQKIAIHKKFLENAVAKQNTTHQLYGYFYLISDYYNLTNYIVTSEYLLKAENLVSKHKNPSWEAALCFKKALLLEIKEDRNGRLKQYKLAFEKSKIAKDSIYMAESLEQISAVYGEMDEFEKAEQYFKLALPLLKKFDSEKQIALAYNNYSNLKSFKNEKPEALSNIDTAINIIRRTKDVYIEMMYQVNKAVVLIEMSQFEKAEIILKKCEVINLKNNWKDRLTHNHIGLALLYENWGKYESSLLYYKKYYEEKELLNGKDIKIKIASLEAENLERKKEIELKNNQIKIIKYQRKIDQLIISIVIIILILMATLYFWKKQKRKDKLEFDEKISDLHNLTQLLISKNKVLLQQQESSNLDTSINNLAIDNSISIKKILTDADWLSFKTYFEKAYPNYINKIRNVYPKITAAEERLFLCLKLNLNNKEVASILGISNESVKKSRNRLRKRIELSIDDKLNDYIRNF